MSDTRLDMLKRAEMRWMSAEDATITVSARAVAELGRDWKAAEAERGELLRSSSLASYEGMQRRAEITEAEVKRLRRVLEDFAKHGTRHDTNPTVILYSDNPQWMQSHQWWCERARNMDDSVRIRARAALPLEKT